MVGRRNVSLRTVGVRGLVEAVDFAIGRAIEKGKGNVSMTSVLG